MWTSSIFKYPTCRSRVVSQTHSTCCTQQCCEYLAGALESNQSIDSFLCFTVKPNYMLIVNPCSLCVSRNITWVTYKAKFRSENMLENGNKNLRILPCGRIKDNNNSPLGKFHRFLFPFSSIFSDLNFAHMFSIFTIVMSRDRHTVSLGYLYAHTYTFVNDPSSLKLSAMDSN